MDDLPLAPKVSPTIQPTVVKCCLRGCIGFASTQFECSASECGKKVHVVCFEKLLQKHTLNKLQNPHTQTILFVCSKTCYKKAEKQLISQPNRVGWDKDGPGGPSDSLNSESILMEWLLTEGNYRKWRGDKSNNGTRKMAYAKQLSDLFKQKGCKIERTAQAVVKKSNLLKEVLQLRMIGPTTLVKVLRKRMVLQNSMSA